MKKKVTKLYCYADETGQDARSDLYIVVSIISADDQYVCCVIYVDGIDFKKAIELTNALRLKNIKTALVRTARDESEPLIRLADRWVGCVRASLEDNASSKQLVAKATNQGYLKFV